MLSNGQVPKVNVNRSALITSWLSRHSQIAIGFTYVLQMADCYTRKLLLRTLIYVQFSQTYQMSCVRSMKIYLQKEVLREELGIDIFY